MSGHRDVGGVRTVLLEQASRVGLGAADRVVVSATVTRTSTEGTAGSLTKKVKLVLRRG